MKPRKIVFILNRTDISGMLNRYISNNGIIPTVMMVQVLYKAWLNAVIARIKTTNRLQITLKLSLAKPKLMQNTLSRASLANIRR